MNESEIATKKQKKEGEKQKEKEKKKWVCKHKEGGGERPVFKITGNFEYCVKCATETFTSNMQTGKALPHWNPDYHCEGIVEWNDVNLAVSLGDKFMRVFSPVNSTEKGPYTFDSTARKSLYYFDMTSMHVLISIREPCANGPLPRIKNVSKAQDSLEYDIEILRATERIKFHKKRVWFPLLFYVVWHRIFVKLGLHDRRPENTIFSHYDYVMSHFNNLIFAKFRVKCDKWNRWASCMLMTAIGKKVEKDDLYWLIENPFAKEFPEIYAMDFDKLGIPRKEPPPAENIRFSLSCSFKPPEFENFGRDHFNEWFNRHDIHKVLISILYAHKHDPESVFFYLDLPLDMLKIIVREARLFYFWA